MKLYKELFKNHQKIVLYSKDLRKKKLKKVKKSMNKAFEKLRRIIIVSLLAWVSSDLQSYILISPFSTLQFFRTQLCF